MTNVLNLTLEKVQISLWQLPPNGEDPSTEMVDALADCPNKWDGDDCGISMEINGVYQEASPGDWIGRIRGGAEGQEAWVVIRADEIDYWKRSWNLAS